MLEQLQPSTLRVLRLVCRGWEGATSRLLVHLRPEGIARKQLARRFPSLHSLDLSNCCMGVDFASPRMLRLQVRCGCGLGGSAGGQPFQPVGPCSCGGMPPHTFPCQLLGIGAPATLGPRQAAEPGSSGAPMTASLARQPAPLCCCCAHPLPPAVAAAGRALG